jgi:hypothetical protein
MVVLLVVKKVTWDGMTADCLVDHSACEMVSYWVEKLVWTDLQRVDLWVSRVDWMALRGNIGK